jgi:uncharacterized membrane protein YphA (DoxX/SURF4 family)
VNVVLWVLQILLALVFLGAGSQKVLRPKDALRERMSFVEDFSQPMVRFIGTMEILGALGLILPAATGIAPILTPLAAAGLFVTMVGAVVVHIRRKETGAALAAPVVLGLLALFVAIERFGPYHF